MGEIKTNYAGYKRTLLEGDIKLNGEDVQKIMYNSQMVFPGAKSLCSVGDVEIGTQTWAGCNLDVDTFLNGDPILNVESNSQWANLGGTGTAAWCYPNNQVEKGRKFGKLYNRYVLTDPRGIAPEGYRIPSAEEWITLIEYLGGYGVAGRKLKSTEYGGTNESGFTALVGGTRDSQGNFTSGASTFWAGDALTYYNYFGVSTSSSSASGGVASPEHGYSIRLIKNQ